MSNFKLGKQPKKRDPQNFQVRKLLKIIPETPAKCFPSFDINSVEWKMLANDRLGDCVEAAQGHILMSWAHTKEIGLNITESETIKLYGEEAGYDGTENTDNGTVMLDALNYWRKNKFDGREIMAFAELSAGSQFDLKQSIYIFNGALLGLELPVSVQGKDIWEVPKRYSPNWGGHCVCAIAYDESYIYFVSWGSIYKMTWDFYRVYCDEAYALIAHTYLRNHETINNNIDLKTLEQDLEKLH